jgi:ABC-type transport system involved in Fe-S cluster assembly fused permease/ATPase subunit
MSFSQLRVAIMDHPAKHIIDFAVVCTVFSTVAGWLPPIVAFVGLVWYGICFYDRFRYGPRH